MDINASIAWAPLLRTVTPSACSQGIGDTSRVLLIILPICRLASLASLMTCQEKRKTVPVLLFNGKYDECVYTRLCQAMLKQHCAGSCETPTTSCFTSSMRRRSSATSAHARGLKGTQPVMRHDRHGVLDQKVLPTCGAWTTAYVVVALARIGAALWNAAPCQIRLRSRTGLRNRGRNRRMLRNSKILLERIHFGRLPHHLR